MPKFSDTTSLTKLTVTLVVNEAIGAFVFDVDVNDAVKILKKDRAADIRQFVQDIQTFPLNEDDAVDVEEFVERMKAC